MEYTWPAKSSHPLCFCAIITEESADLDSIEAVANEVLTMNMPSTPKELQSLTEDIRKRVESLSDVEVILQQSAGDIAKAEMLLDEAKKARYWVLHWSLSPVFYISVFEPDYRFQSV